MRKFLALLFALLLCVATKVYAEDAATVTVTVKDLPQKLQNRTVIVTLAMAHLIQNQQLLF
jgi:TRAP-type C4-dicarboxylate transport system permease small subunit